MNSIPRVNLFVFHWYVMTSLSKFQQWMEEYLTSLSFINPYPATAFTYVGVL